jgi:aminocarboxymuconate-semialdehyde decarboxylase
MIIDIFTHVFPVDVFKRIDALGLDLGPIGKRTRSMKLLFDMEARFKVMDGFGDYRQVVALPNPPLEDFTDAGQGAEISRAANDALADLTARHPDRFAGFIAALSLTDPEDAAKEAARACRELGAAGVQLFTNVAGAPLDEPRFAPRVCRHGRSRRALPRRSISTVRTSAGSRPGSPSAGPMRPR